MSGPAIAGIGWCGVDRLLITCPALCVSGRERFDDDATLEAIQDWMVDKLSNLDRVLGPKLESYPI